jgi:hypothetical protein
MLNEKLLQLKALSLIARCEYSQRDHIARLPQLQPADLLSRGLGKPETFNFLGFTHICGRSRQGVFQLKRQTRRAKLRALAGRRRPTAKHPADRKS